MNIGGGVKNPESVAEGSLAAVIDDQPKVAVAQSKNLWIPESRPYIKAVELTEVKVSKVIEAKPEFKVDDAENKDNNVSE